MASSPKVGEVGKIFRLNAFYNMNANTQLTLVFTKQDGTTLTVDKSDGVTAPGVDAIHYDDDGNITETFLANEYFEYTWKSGDLDQSGRWFSYGIYEDGTPKKFIGDQAEFTVYPVS